LHHNKNTHFASKASKRGQSFKIPGLPPVNSEKPLSLVISLRGFSMYIRTAGGFSLPISHGQAGLIMLIYKISKRSKAFRGKSLLLNFIWIEGEYVMI
jgi:hypothetical protein